MSVRPPAFCLLAATLLTSACDEPRPNNAAPLADQVLSTEDRAILEAAKRKSAQLKDLRSNPSRYVEAGNWKSYDKGIINDYSQATHIELTNKSSFDVSEIEGEFTYLSKKGRVMATVPVKFVGELRAGDTQMMRVSARTISGNADSGRLRVTKVRARG